MEESSERTSPQNWFRSYSSTNLRHPSPSAFFFMLIFMFIAVPSFLSFSSQFIKPHLVLVFLAVLGILLCRKMAVGNGEVEQEPHHHYNHQRQPLPNFLLNYGFYIMIILITALVLIFIVIPFLSFFSQNFKPNVVQKNWSSLILVLVFSAILCGLLSSSTTEADEREDKKADVKEEVVADSAEKKKESENHRQKKKKDIHHHYHFHQHQHPHHHHHYHHLRRLHRRLRNRTTDRQQLPTDVNQQQVQNDTVPTDQQQMSTDKRRSPNDRYRQQVPTHTYQQLDTVPINQQQLPTDQRWLPADGHQPWEPTPKVVPNGNRMMRRNSRSYSDLSKQESYQKLDYDFPRYYDDINVGRYMYGSQSEGPQPSAPPVLKNEDFEDLSTDQQQVPTPKLVANGNRTMRRNSRSYSDLSRQESYQKLVYESPRYCDDINVGRYRYGSRPQGPKPSAPPLITKEDFENFSRQCSIGEPQSVVDPSQPPPPPPIKNFINFLKGWKKKRSGSTPPPPPPPPSSWAPTTASTSSGPPQLSIKSPEIKKILDHKDSDAWIPPIYTELKINFSAAWITPEKVTGIGLILRDSTGLCRGARGRKCFSVSSEEASARAALEAVTWAKQIPLYGVTFEGDSKCIIDYLQNKTTNVQESTASLLKEALQVSNFMSGTYNRFQYVSRNANKVANETAILVRISETSFDGEANLPSYISSQLANERVISTL